MTSITVEDAQTVFKTLQPDVTVDTVESVGTESFKTVFCITAEDKTQYALYCVPQEHLEQRFHTGLAVLQHVREETDLPVPHVIAADVTGNKAGVLCYLTPWIAGKRGDVLYRKMGPKEKKAVVYEAGKLLAELHEDTGFRKFGRLTSADGKNISLAEATGDWEEWIDYHVEHLLDTLDESVFSTIVPEAREFLERRVPLKTSSESVLHHNDYRPGNVLIDGEEITGILDWDWSYSTTPTYSIIHGVEAFVYWFGDAPTDGELENAFYEGYESVRDLPTHIPEQKAFYHVLWEVEQMAILHELHGPDMEEERVTAHIEELEKRLKRYDTRDRSDY